MGRLLEIVVRRPVGWLAENGAEQGECLTFNELDGS